MMKSILRRIGLLAGSFLVSGLIGCGPDLSAEGGSPAPLAGPGTQAAPLTVNTFFSWQLPTVGTAGTPFSDSCPAGYVGTGLSVRTSVGLDQVQLICRRLNLDGTLGATAFTPARGGSGGTAASGSCASNQIMSGQVLGGDPVRQVGALCSTATRLKNATGGSDSTLSPLGSPGPVSTTACPAGSAITGLYGRTGVGAEQLGFRCTRLDDVKSDTIFGNGPHLVRINNVSINGSIGPSTTVDAGQNLELRFWQRVTNDQYGCPSCRTRYQLVLGWFSSDPSVAWQLLPCTFDDFLYQGQSAEAFTSLSLTAPTQPGTYTLRAMVDNQSSCNPEASFLWGMTTTAAIGEIRVY